MRLLFSTLLVLSLAACQGSKEPAAVTPASSPTLSAVPAPLEARLGQIVTLEGVAQDAKLGALLLMGGSGTIWIDGLDAWPPSVSGKRVQVTGRVIQRADLPVFVQREGDPVMAGMPVPPGTDLEKARRRILLAEATWKEVGPGR